MFHATCLYTLSWISIYLIVNIAPSADQAMNRLGTFFCKSASPKVCKKKWRMWKDGKGVCVKISHNRETLAIHMQTMHFPKEMWPHSRDNRAQGMTGQHSWRWPEGRQERQLPLPPYHMSWVAKRRTSPLHHHHHHLRKVELLSQESSGGTNAKLAGWLAGKWLGCHQPRGEEDGGAAILPASRLAL